MHREPTIMANKCSRLNKSNLPSHSFSSLQLLFITFLALGLPNTCFAQVRNFTLSSTDINILVGNSEAVTFQQSGNFEEVVLITAVVQHSDIVEVTPVQFNSSVSNDSVPHSLLMYGIGPGHSDILFNATPDGYVDTSKTFLRVTVMHSNVVEYISHIVGWIYFLAWSVSFYPQIYINFKRRSVVGLNFDFLALNIVGFTLYSMFNCGLYFSDVIKDQYLSLHPRSVNPVKLNDVFFSLHAMFATCITITQCCFFERGEQTVSLVARLIIAVFFAIVFVTSVLGWVGQITWLMFLYYCSYIKLATTLIKYVPQAYMNYKRKSTVGWSIGNIFLDCVGGSLSILQMLLNAYNYNDWISIFGDVTKFGLGMFSLIFDIFFMVQHYVFYRKRDEKEENLTEKF